MSQAQSITSEVYFEKWVAHAVRHQATKKLNLQYVIRLFGDTGTSTAWTLDFAKGVVSRGDIANPSFYLEMDNRDFEAMSTDSLDIEEAIVNGRVRWSGSLQHLEVLGRLLMPATAKID